MANRINMIGKRFGRLVVQAFSHKGKHRELFWICLCDCGNTTKPILGANLRQGNSTSCGCFRKEVIINNLTNKTFGYLTVVRITEKRYKDKVIWECKCICGNIIQVVGNSLTSCNTTSCGCRHKEIITKDITQQVFGYLTALFPTKKRDSMGSVIWKCLCICGNNHDVSLNNLTNKVNPVSSCGCRRISKFHEDVRNTLKNLGIEILQEEYPLPQKTSVLYVDILVFYKNMLIAIECNGIQHYKPIDAFGGEEGYKKQVERDNRKKKSLRGLNIPLLEVHYNEKNLEEFLKESLQDVYLTRNKRIYKTFDPSAPQPGHVPYLRNPE